MRPFFYLWLKIQIFIKKPGFWDFYLPPEIFNKFSLAALNGLQFAGLERGIGASSDSITMHNYASNFIGAVFISLIDLYTVDAFEFQFPFLAGLR